jgi:polyhydroxyalkanoate synthesis regulator protein
MLKKYDNRRLYDTEKSRYVNIQQIADRVIYGEKVVRNKDGKDVSADILLRVIRTDGLNADQLRAVIVAYRAGITVQKRSAPRGVRPVQ